MTATFLVLTVLVAIGDWFAVARRNDIQLIAKPLTLLLLIAAAAFADMGPAKPWVILALALGLLGDVALIFADEGEAADAAFMIGVGSFLLGHLAYLVAFIRHGLHTWQLVGGVLVVAGVAARAMPTVYRKARDSDGTVVANAVACYAAALGAMTILGFGTAAIATSIGALAFLASDTTLAWDRFVQPMVRGPVIVIVTYHVAQVLIVVGLIR